MKTYSLSLSGKEKITLLSNLATMLAAGIPILESVDSLLDESKGSQKKVLEMLRDDLIAGNHVYASFAKFPKVFSKVTVNLMKAAEEAGTLETTLQDIKSNLQKEMEFSDKVKSAMTYPAFVLVIFAAVFLTILTFVVPKISTVFSRLPVTLPFATQVMITLSNFLLSNTIQIIIGLIFLSILLFFLYRTQRQLFLSAVFSLPVLSTLVRDIDLTRFTRSMHLLLNSGLPIATALELSQEVVVKKEVADLIAKSKQMVISGKELSLGLRSKKGVFPGMMVKLIEVGEKSGTLAESMGSTSDYLDYQVSKSLKTATALLEPIMLVVVGVGIGGMMMAIIAPIYGLIGSVGAR